MTENFTELLITLFSSAGLAGALFAALLSHVLKKARADADRRRQERTSLEIMRCEGEAAAGELLLTLVAFVQGRCGEAELKTRGTNTAAFWKKQAAQGQAGRRAHRALSAYGCGRRTDCAVPLFTPFRKGAKTESDMGRRRGFYRRLQFFFMSRRTAVKRLYARNSKTRTYPDSAVTIYSASASQPAFVKCLGMISDLYCSALRTILRKYNGLRTRSQTKRPVAFR